MIINLLRMICTQTGYTIVEIEDEAVPLVATPGKSYFPYVIVVMVLIIILWSLVEYFIVCQKQRARIQVLSDGTESYCGWNIRRLRISLAELELTRTDRIVESMQMDLVKRLKEDI